MTHPYSHLGAEAFWRTGVAETGIFGMTNLWSSPWTMPANAGFATYGSCFAQHISRALVAREMNWLNCETAPGKTSASLARKYNYGVFSARTGNIYTAAQMLTWVRLAAGVDAIDGVELSTDPFGRVQDMLRPGIEPTGFADTAEARASLASSVQAFRTSIATADVFVFTLGLTEGWVNRHSGQAYTICPGTSVGQFDDQAHVFHNYTYPEVRSDLEEAFALMRGLNPHIRILLTVSPVPLVATAAGKHVLVATQYSKSVLRAVAGDLAATSNDVDYFPSYEIIAAPPTRAAFFEPDMRSVAPQGVDLVMSHFFAGLDLSGRARAAGTSRADAEASAEAQMAAEELVCEEMVLEQFNGN